MSTPGIAIQGSSTDSRPPNPNTLQTEPTTSQPKVTHQASPAIVATSSHLHTHVLPRRFIGRIPEIIVNSDEHEKQHKHFKHARKAGIKKIKESESQSQDLDGRRKSVVKVLGDKRKSVISKIKVKRKGKDGKITEEEIDLDDNDWNEGDDDDDDDDQNESDQGNGKKGWGFGGGGSKKKKKKRKDVWLGESFDIGREFRSINVRQDDKRIEENREAVVENGENGQENVIAQNATEGKDGEDAVGENRGQSSKRPPNSSRQTTQESFVTARTQFSDAQSTLTVGGQNEEDDSLHNGYELQQAGPSTTSEASPSLSPIDNHRGSQSSSLRPLIPYDGPHPTDQTHLTTVQKLKEPLTSPLTATKSTPSLRKRLKSAIRKPSISTKLPNGVQENETVRIKPKTVQFPVDLEHHIQHEETTRKGNRAPASPTDVLSREGEEVEGTSAAAVEEAMEEQTQKDEADDILTPGQVILRDRMLVRVGYHGESNIKTFDEAAQRRQPLAKLEAMEEYIVVWRGNRVEFYQDWGNLITEHLRGSKRLCFLIPLDPGRTSLSVFNETDMTITLTTSAEKLSSDMEYFMRSQTTRLSNAKDKVKNSKQIHFLRGKKQGTHVFIMKIAERSRAIDWYWEIWRELGGELPTRLDILIPSLSTSVRLKLPSSNEEDQVGSKETCQTFNIQNTIKTAKDMLDQAHRVDELLQQRADHGENLELELAWKSVNGNLDWICWDTTVQGKERNWALLAGLAKVSEEKGVNKILQLRPARHRSEAIKLDDGSVLNEPPGVEGYLVRHVGGNTPKEEVYVSTHEGYAFVGLRKDAKPPLEPKKEGSTPSDLFPDLDKLFQDSERRRMSTFLEHSLGCVDLRNIEHIDWLPDIRSREGGEDALPASVKGLKLKYPERCFLLQLTQGQDSVFEVRTQEDAKEWVGRLRELHMYWKRFHRVDARMKMDATKLSSAQDPFAGTPLAKDNDSSLSDLWDWCVIKGCRSITMVGRLFIKKGKWTKFRSRVIVISGGCLIAFKIKQGEAVHQRKQRYPLFGAYTYSGLLAQEELHESAHESAFTSQAKVYQDGLQSSDGLEDRTFCVRLAMKPSQWGKNRTQPWEIVKEKKIPAVGLSKAPPFLLICRTRSRLERDTWIWAINAEMERQVRANVDVDNNHRNHGIVQA